MSPRTLKFSLVLGAPMAFATVGCGVETGSGPTPVANQHVREAVTSGIATVSGRLPADQVLQLDLVLPLRDSAGLTNFLADLYNPASASYRHFVTPAEFTARFGPTEGDYATVAFPDPDRRFTSRQIAHGEKSLSWRRVPSHVEPVKRRGN